MAEIFASFSYFPVIAHFIVLWPYVQEGGGATEEVIAPRDVRSPAQPTRWVLRPHVRGLLDD